MQLAEVIYHNQQAMLKLPSNFKPIQKTWYVAQNEQTGQAMITTCQPEWNDFLQAWQQLDGTEWDNQVAQHSPPNLSTICLNANSR